MFFFVVVILAKMQSSHSFYCFIQQFVCPDQNGKMLYIYLKNTYQNLQDPIWGKNSMNEWSAGSPQSSIISAHVLQWPSHILTVSFDAKKFRKLTQLNQWGWGRSRIMIQLLFFNQMINSHSRKTLPHTTKYTNDMYPQWKSLWKSVHETTVSWKQNN